MGQNKLGVYLANGHDRGESWEYIKHLQPIGVRILDPSIDVIKRVYNLVPNAIIYPRYWAISENQAEYQSNPVNLANQHVAFWKDKIAEYERNGIDRNRIVTVSTNEPRIWSDIDRNHDYDGWLSDMKRAYKYNLEYNLTIATGLGKEHIKAGLLNFSVGHPANLKDGLLSYWDWAYELVEPTLRYGHNWTIHEYFSKNGIQDGWGWLCGRWQHIPFDVPIVIGETGLDRFTTEPGVEQHQRGWQGVMTPEKYAIELNSYVAHLGKDSRVIVAFPFLTDYMSNMWQSFDTNPAYREILREKDVTYDVYLPIISVPGTVPPNPPTQPEPPVPPTETVYRLKWPPVTPVTGYFNSAHSGIDVGIPRTPLYAMYDGDVAWSDVDNPAEYNGGYGQYIRIYHPALKVHSFYAHLSERLVQQGQKVKTGDLIGYSGNSGNSSNFHLHFEIRLANDDGSYRKGVSKFKNSQVDPIAYLYALGNIFGHD